jgi:Bacterial transcriptional regulator
VQYRVGGRLPLHSTAVGLVLLAFAPPALQEEFLAQPMPREPDRVLIRPDVMRRTLAEVRRGWITRAAGPGELADRLGLDRAVLTATLAEFNAAAAVGRDDRVRTARRVHGRPRPDRPVRDRAVARRRHDLRRPAA